MHCMLMESVRILPIAHADGPNLQLRRDGATVWAMLPGPPALPWAHCPLLPRLQDGPHLTAGVRFLTIIIHLSSRCLAVQCCYAVTTKEMQRNSRRGLAGSGRCIGWPPPKPPYPTQRPSLPEGIWPWAPASPHCAFLPARPLAAPTPLLCGVQVADLNDNVLLGYTASGLTRMG